MAVKNNLFPSFLLEIDNIKNKANQSLAYFQGCLSFGGPDEYQGLQSRCRMTTERIELTASEIDWDRYDKSDRNIKLYTIRIGVGFHVEGLNSTVYKDTHIRLQPVSSTTTGNSIINHSQFSSNGSTLLNHLPKMKAATIFSLCLAATGALAVPTKRAGQAVTITGLKATYSDQQGSVQFSLWDPNYSDSTSASLTWSISQLPHFSVDKSN